MEPARTAISGPLAGDEEVRDHGWGEISLRA